MIISIDFTKYFMINFTFMMMVFKDKHFIITNLFLKLENHFNRHYCPILIALLIIEDNFIIQIYC